MGSTTGLGLPDSGLSPFSGRTSGPSSPSVSTSEDTLVGSESRRTPSITSSCRIWPSICTQSLPRKGDRNDCANNLEKPCHGWPELTQLITENPSFEAFQSFRDLHIKS